ncbi:MAG TPA: hypothetical protein VGG29_17270 [Caulobacteraceae bacterium]|jgi:hypothetical protein
MLRDGLQHGFAAADWQAAKDEARAIMIARARVRGMIAYSDLAARLTKIKLGAHDSRLFHFLGEISAEEDAAGRGMLTVLVVHKSGDRQPGPGFFELAQLLGRDTTDVLDCWVKELNGVYAVWSKR